MLILCRYYILSCCTILKICSGHGRLFFPGNRVFGIKNRNIRKTLLSLVLNKRKETLISILINHVEPGSGIYSDKLSPRLTSDGRSHLEEYCLNHYYINYSLAFLVLKTHQKHRENMAKLKSINTLYQEISLGRTCEHAYSNTFQFTTMFSGECLYDVFFKIILRYYPSIHNILLY